MKPTLPSDLDGRSALILSDFLYDLADYILAKYDGAICNYFAEAWVARTDEAVTCIPRARPLPDEELPF